VATNYGLDVDSPGLFQGVEGLIAGAETATMGDLQAYRSQLDRAVEVIPGAIRRSAATEAARGMAAGMGQAGAMPIGGGSAGLLAQIGLDSGVKTGQALTELEANILPQLMSARAGAAEKMGQMALGAKERKTGGVAEAMNQVSSLVNTYHDWTGTNEGAILRGIETLYGVSTDPAVREYLRTEHAKWKKDWESEHRGDWASDLGGAALSAGAASGAALGSAVAGGLVSGVGEAW